MARAAIRAGEGSLELPAAIRVQACAVQERGRYVPQGWAKPPGFSASDLVAASHLITNAVSGPSAAGAPLATHGPRWPLLTGLLEAAIYGGRIDRDSDARVLRACLHRFFSARSTDGGAPLLGTAAQLPPLADGTFRELQRVVAALPDVDAPAMFGLPASVDVAALEAEGAATGTQLRALALGTLGGAEADVAEWREKLRPIVRMLRTACRSVAQGDASEPRRAASLDDEQVRLTDRHLSLVLFLQGQALRTSALTCCSFFRLRRSTGVWGCL
jgi:Dynein heavy chain AAA lid domain